MKTKKRFIATLIATFIFAASLMLCGKEAKAVSYLAGGQCGLKGDNIEWYLSEDGVLTFEGKGEMKSWDYGSRTPWYPYMKNVKKVVVKKGVTTIGSYAFSAEYPNLTKVTFPSTLTTVGYSSFWGCKALETVNIPEGVTLIKDFAFYKCASLNSVTFPTSLKKIGLAAFELSGVRTVTVPAHIVLDTQTFEDCDRLVSVTFGTGSGSTVVPNWAFNHCDNLETVTIKDTVTSIGHSAFGTCPKLKTVKIGANVKEIQPLAFTKCTSLEELVIPDSVSTIGNTYHTGGSFDGCTSLKKVTFGTGITFVDGNAFKNCGNINKIYFCGDAPTFEGTDTFPGCIATAYYPKGNSTWKPSKLTNQGGKLDWIQWEVPVSHFRPSITSLTNKSNGILVKWSKVKYADGYYVYRKAGTATSWTKIKTTTSTSYTDTKATYNGRKYQYKIVAFDEGSVSKNSSSKTKYYVKRTTPSSLSNLSGKKMKVKWTKNSAASGYQIRYSKKSSFSTYSTKTVGKVTYTTVSKLTKGSTYYVKMRAYKTVNGTKYYSDWSTVKKIKIKK